MGNEQQMEWKAFRPKRFETGYSASVNDTAITLCYNNNGSDILVVLRKNDGSQRTQVVRQKEGETRDYRFIGAEIMERGEYSKENNFISPYVSAIKKRINEPREDPEALTEEALEKIDEIGQNFENKKQKKAKGKRK